MTYINAANDLTCLYNTRAHWAPSSFRAQLKKGCPMLCWARTVEKIVLNMKIKITGDKLGGRTTPLRHMILGEIVG